MASGLHKPVDVLHSEGISPLAPNQNGTLQSSDTRDVQDEDVDVINRQEEQIPISTTLMALKLDKRGLPLSPQPSDNQDDPLNWPPLLKLSIALQISFLALLGPLSSAIINPAFVPLAASFSITPVTASYELTVYIIFAGIGPLFTTPLANIYGRRPIYLFGNILAGVMNLVAANCTSWGGLLVTRVFCGIGAGATVAIGAATICDLFFMHERGFYLGIYTFFLTNGPHIAPLIGGFLAQYLDWRYCFSVPAYVQFATFLITLLFLPETLYDRSSSTLDTLSSKSHHKIRTLFPPLVHKVSEPPSYSKLLLSPLALLAFPPQLLPTIYYTTLFSYGTVLFASTGAPLFHSLFNFTPSQTGLLLSIPLLIGCLIGEANAGWVADYMLRRYARRHGGKRIPEARLNVLWGGVLVPIGVVIVGSCLAKANTDIKDGVGRETWLGVAFGMGISSAGLQIGTTVVYAYMTDHAPQLTPQISTLLNTFRQIFAALLPFYAVRFGERIGYQWAWLVFALINLLFLGPVTWLSFVGAKRWPVAVEGEETVDGERARGIS